jgi:hypothetical protein
VQIASFPLRGEHRNLGSEFGRREFSFSNFHFSIFTVLYLRLVLGDSLRPTKELLY